MKRDAVDYILQLAFLEGRINTHGAYEKSVTKRRSTAAPETESRAELLRRLEAELASSPRQAHTKLTVGLFLQTVRQQIDTHRGGLSDRLGVSRNICRMMERDRISPLKIPLEAWRQFRSVFNLSTGELVEMIRRTHRLVYFRPSFRATLARYDSRRGRLMKRADFERATQELYAKAELVLPPVEQAKLDRFLAMLAT